MDANITLSLRDIYEEFLYNRDIGHEQIMYIIEQQQKQEREENLYKFEVIKKIKESDNCNVLVLKRL